MMSSILSSFLAHFSDGVEETKTYHVKKLRVFKEVKRELTRVKEDGSRFIKLVYERAQLIHVYVCAQDVASIKCHLHPIF